MANPARARSNTRPAARERSVAEARAKGINTSNKAGAMLVDEDKPLTELERTFVKFWAAGDSPATAASRTGIQNTYAYRLIYKPNVLKAYRIEKEAYEAASGMTRKRVIDGFLEAVEMAKVLGEPSTMVAGWREIGKMVGYYEPVTIKHEVNHTGKVLHERLDKMDDAELLRLIEENAQRMAADQASVSPQLKGASHDGIDDITDVDGEGA